MIFAILLSSLAAFISLEFFLSKIKIINDDTHNIVELFSILKKCSCGSAFYMTKRAQLHIFSCSLATQKICKQKFFSPLIS